MTNDDSTAIVTRFFEATDRLINDGIIRRKNVFPDRYGVNRRNFETLRKEPHRNMFQCAWLWYLVRDYNVNPRWLLTGTGSFYGVSAEKRDKCVTMLADMLSSI